MKEITNLLRQIEDNYWADDYIRRPELGAVIDDYLAKKDFSGAEVTYGDYGYRAVYPDRIIDGEISIDYGDISADSEEDGHQFIEDRCMPDKDGNVLTLEFDGDEEAIGYLHGREIGRGPIDINTLRCEEADVRELGVDRTCGIPVYRFRDTLTISGHLGFNEGEFIRENRKSLEKAGWHPERLKKD